MDRVERCSGFETLLRVLMARFRVVCCLVPARVQTEQGVMHGRNGVANNGEGVPSFIEQQQASQDAFARLHEQEQYSAGYLG